MTEIVNSQTDPLLLHPERLIELEQQDRNESGLPVVAVNDLRPLAGPEHELERRPAEERKPRDVPGACPIPPPAAPSASVAPRIAGG